MREMHGKLVFDLLRFPRRFREVEISFSDVRIFYSLVCSNKNYSLDSDKYNLYDSIYYNILPQNIIYNKYHLMNLNRKKVGKCSYIFLFERKIKSYRSIIDIRIILQQCREKCGYFILVHTSHCHLLLSSRSFFVRPSLLGSYGDLDDNMVDSTGIHARSITDP